MLRSWREMLPQPYRRREAVVVLGRRFTLLIEGPVPPGRYEGRVWDGTILPWRRPYLRAAIRGREPGEVRERALEVLHTYVGLDRFRRLVETIAARVAPGARVEVGEDARDVIVTLAGRYTLLVPLAVARDDVLDRDADVDGLRRLVRGHLQAYVRPRG